MDDGEAGTAVLWRWLDRTGCDAARIAALADGHRVAGTAVVVAGDQPCRLDYDVVCDRRWVTREARVEGWIGGAPVHVLLRADGRGSWWRDGVPQPHVDGCLDVDLGFTPATNTLPIRRLGLEVGTSSAVRAAWVRFPEFTLEALDQVYRRTGAAAYRYESGEGRFTAGIAVTAGGVVTDYEGFWSADVISGVAGVAPPGRE